MVSRHCSEHFIPIISLWIGAAISPFLWRWRLRRGCLTIASRVDVPADSDGPADSSGMWGSWMPCSAAEPVPWGGQLCPQDSGRLSHESTPHPTQTLGSEVTSGWSWAGGSLTPGHSVMALEFHPQQRDKKCPEVVPGSVPGSILCQVHILPGAVGSQLFICSQR